jgi:hypothetical protein
MVGAKRQNGPKYTKIPPQIFMTIAKQQWRIGPYGAEANPSPRLALFEKLKMGGVGQGGDLKSSKVV